MSETKLIPTEKQFLQPLKEFEKKQNQLVKENPFIKITNNETFESAKKSRTSLVKGRTELQGQQKTIYSSVNSIKTSVKNETERLIEITKPAEDKQQAEVKRYEAIQEEKRLERERIAEQKKQEAMEAISDVFSGWIKDINELVYEKIDEFQQSFEEYFSQLDTSSFEDLEIYYNGRYAQLTTQFNQKCIELEKNQELLISQSENRFQQFKTKWMERFMDANINNIHQLNLDFDEEVPSIDPDTFFTFKDQFIQETNKFRDKLIDITNVCKLQQEKVDEEIVKEQIKNSIKEIFRVLKNNVEDMTFSSIITSSNMISVTIDAIRTSEYYNEFKDSIELNISNIENLTLAKQKELQEKQVEIDAAEKKRIEKQKADNKKNDAAEKKRQKELKPEKDYALNEIKYFTPVDKFKSKDIDVDEIMKHFFKELISLQEKYINQINSL